jgi:hypothetical protein
MYKLYFDQQECDSDDWGPPHGEYPSLREAMAAAGLPGLENWNTMRGCPDEVFTRGKPGWSILASGAAREFADLTAAPVA